MEFSVRMCRNALRELAVDGHENGRKQSAIKNNKFYVQLMQLMDKEPTDLHPKLERLVQLVIEHFNDENNGRSTDKLSKLMIFVSFRDCVDEVVAALNNIGPSVRATRFVGQGTDKQGRKGIAQSEQLEVCFFICLANIC